MFDWQTEEDETVWEDETALPAQKTAVSVLSRRWLPLLIAAISVGISTFLLFRQMQKQSDAVLANVEADIVSSHELIMAAAESKDLDLIRALLSGRDRQWADVQQQLVVDGQFVDRVSLGMMWQPEAQAVISTTIDPMLTRAELVSTQWYDVVTPDGETETISLQQTAVYRRGSQRWLLSPFDEEFWGEWETVDSDRLMLVYPKRDEAIALRLFSDLEEIVDDACTLLDDVSCDSAMHLRIRLEKDVATLNLLADLDAQYQRGVQIKLPTPSLVGVPVDDAGYDALLLGYARVVVTAVIADAVSWTCCEHGPLFQTLVEYQLSQLGLKYWPISLDDHLALWEGEQLISLNDLFVYWNSPSVTVLTEGEKQYLQAAVDFLLRQFPHQSAAALQRGMNGSNISFLRWIRSLPFEDNDAQFVSPSALINSLDQQWRLYAQLQAGISAAGTAPISLPDQDILLHCTQQFGDSPDSVLVRYDFSSEQWVEEDFLKDVFALFYPLANDDGMLRLKLFFDEIGARSEIDLWQGGEQVQSLILDSRYVLTFGQMDPTGRYLAAIKFAQDEAFSQSAQPIVFDLNNCEQDHCAEREVSGSPLWSPNGEKAIYAASETFPSTAFLPDGRIWIVEGTPSAQTFTLYVGHAVIEPFDVNGLDKIGTGHAPFWIDDNRFGFVETVDENTQQIVIGSDAAAPVPIVETADLQAALQNDVRLGRLSISYVVPYPQNREKLFVAASDIDAQGYIFLVDAKTGAVEYRFSVGFLTNHLLGFSPDGRYVVATSVKRDSEVGNFPNDFVTIHDIARNETQDILYDAPEIAPVNFIFDWSADGNWLVTILDNGLIQLIAPHENYRQVLAHDFGNCQMAAWVNP